VPGLFGVLSVLELAPIPHYEEAACCVSLSTLEARSEEHKQGTFEGINSHYVRNLNQIDDSWSRLPQGLSGIIGYQRSYTDRKY